MSTSYMKKIILFAFFANIALLQNSFAKTEKKIKELPVISNAKASITKSLKDPDSANFRNVFTIDGINVCGEINSKNSYGGYVGFTRFVVIAEKVRFETAADDQYKSFDYHFWDQFCLKNKNQ